jgi:4-amino-4-deoxy-L-arabinose transferase-like glycosyltransferase
MNRLSSSTIYRQLGITALDRRIDLLWLGVATLAAGLLLTWQLGDVPLRDWDEGIGATVARQIWRSRFTDYVWLFPQSIDGGPYLNKPPLMHWLIALAYQIGGVNAAMSRLPSALLTTASVPLLYWVGRELFHRRLSAILATGVYLTCLPVVRQGRLAMLEGGILCFLLLMWACLLRARRNLQWSLGIGVAIGLMCLTKGLLGILLGAIGLVFLFWDTPRILRSRYFWLGLGLGTLPVAAWYGAQYWHYGATFLQAHLFEQSLNRLGQAVERNGGPPWYYLLEILKQGSVWLLFLPIGLKRLRQDWHLSWARLIALWGVSYFAIISCMQTKLPWYAMPLYPAIALLIGMGLTQIWEPEQHPTEPGIPDTKPRRRFNPTYHNWAYGCWALAGLTAIAAIYYLFQDHELDVVLVCVTLMATLVAAAIFALQQSRQFILILIWGSYLSLIGLMSSNNWVWELAEQPDVGPIAALIQTNTPAQQPIYAVIPAARPSLEFYADRPIRPIDAIEQAPVGAHLLVPNEQSSLDLPAGFKFVAQSPDWAIVRRDALY